MQLNGDQLGWRRGGASRSSWHCRAHFGLAALGLLAAGCAGHTNNVGTGAHGSHAAHAQVVAHRNAQAGSAIVATAVQPLVQIYRSASSRNPILRLRNPTAVGAPLVFLVKERRAGWDQVYLPVRPDGSTGWIEERNVQLAYDPYSLQVLRSRHQLILSKHGRVVGRFPVAVGRSVLPTPTGRYYIVDLLKQPDPNGPYGPYAFGLSAFSKVLYHFGGGPGQIGIHGTNEANSVGHNASHGCIRIPNWAINRLARQLPLGTPVNIDA